MEKRAQASVEYLMIMAVVLVIALVVISLSLFFTTSSPVDEEIRVYWSTSVRPIRIIEMQGYYYPSGSAGNGEIALVLQNVDTKPVYLRNIVLEPYPATGNEMVVYGNHSTDGTPAVGVYGYAGPTYTLSPDFSITLAPSEKVSIYLRGNATSSYFCSTNNDELHYRKTLTLQYDTPYFDDIIFTGTKPITGSCNRIG